MTEKTVEVTAELIVSVRFQLPVDPSTPLSGIEQAAKDASERVALRIVSDRNTHASASVHNVRSFSVKM